MPRDARPGARSRVASGTRALSRRAARAPLVLAIDIGSSSTRAIAFDAEARSVAGATARVEHRLTTDTEGAATLDADAVVADVVRVIDAVLARLGRRASDVAAVGTSVFWHSLVGVDGRDRATTPLFTWADRRARDAARALSAELDGEAFHERTGCYLHAAYPAVKLRWLRDRDRSAFRQTRTWLSIAEYVMLAFHGIAHTSHSVASGTGMYDQATRAWDRATCDAVGVSVDALPRISDDAAGGLRDRFARRWPALAHVPWAPGVGDGALANVGSGCATADRAAISLGTSGAVRACYAADRARAPNGLFEYRLDERYVVVGGAVNNGGNAIGWIRRTWGDPHALPSEHDLTALPLFAGERTPWWDDGAAATLAGLRLTTTPGQIAVALVEAIALRLAAAGRSLLSVRPGIERLVASGGAFAARPELARVVADAVDRPVALAEDPEASARGAAILALRQIGALGSIEFPARTSRMFRPNRERGERYRERLRKQDRLYAALREAEL